jgi:DNA-binding beta-propeller fold protein YncE
LRDSLDSQNPPPARTRARCRRGKTLPPFLIAAGLLAGTLASCRKAEKAAAGTGTPAAETVATKVEKPPEKDVPFSLSETPQNSGSPYSGLKEPQQAAFDEKGRLWIVDSANSRVAVFNSAGGYLGGFGGLGSGHFGLRNPEGIAIHADNLYVADTWNGRVVAYTLSGAYKGEVHGLYGPRGVAVAPNGRVFVTDSGNGRVMSYDAALGDEKVIGKKGSGKGEFSGPIGAAVSPAGRVYVADMGNHRIQGLDADGKPLTSMKYPGLDVTWNVYPEIDSNETVYVPDPDAAQVFAMNRSGAVQKKWSAGDDGQKFVRPCCLALDRKQGVLYVINAGNNTVSKLKLR